MNRSSKRRPNQDGEVRLVDTVHVAGDRLGHEAGSVAVPDIEDVMGLEIVRADQIAVERDVVAQQRIGDDPLAAAEVLARVARLDGRPLYGEFLAIDAAVQRLQIERIMREDRQAAMALLMRSLAACSVACRRYCW